jgi:bifunctional non-homologous end joining protein LigD
VRERRASAGAGKPRAADRLTRYGAKRDFGATPEPAAANAPARRRRAAARPRFVIHEHSATRLHWDLRLERDGVLASWAVPKGLPIEPKDNRFAAHTEDHPLEYLEFEGEIPKGSYGAGTMSIWDAGTYEELKWEPRKVEVALHGERLSGRYALFAIEQGEQPKDWMIHRMDPPADPDAEEMPQRVAPMLARAGELPRDDERWAYEIKWDGIRAIAYSTPGVLRLQSRNLIDISERYPELARLNRALSTHRAILDGEIVALDERGRPSFGALQQRMQVQSAAQAKRLAARSQVTYMLFDLLWLDGHSLMELPYAERRERLAGLSLKGAAWQTPEHVRGNGEALLEAATAQGLEGVVAKRLDSAYEPGARSRCWLKIKTMGRQEFVIGGWLPGKGRRKETIGALLLGVHDPDGALRYVGRVGSGISERELDDLSRRLGGLERGGSPFARGGRPPREAVYCEPRLVCEVRFSEWTSAGQLRQPSYLGLREGKQAEEVVAELPEDAGDGGRDGGRDGARAARRAGGARAAAAESSAKAAPGPAGPRTRRSPAPAPLAIEEKTAKTAFTSVEGHELKLSNLDKVLYPQAGFTKRALIDYYARAAEVMLAHLQGRALTVTRWPDGVEAKSFFQKQAPAHRPEWVRTVALAAASKRIDYTLADDLATLVWLANLAAIEMHTPLALARHPERPTSMVFDLDPGAPAGVIDCARVALELRAMFEGMGLESFVKSSGSKGLQVYVPLNNSEVRFEHTKAFAKTVAEVLEHDDPGQVVSQMTKTRRTGRVLIDWSQNDRNKTTVCVYSLRAVARPTASTPLRWGEVRAAVRAGKQEKLAFEAHEVLARVRDHGDLFAPVLSLVQELPSF